MVFHVLDKKENIAAVCNKCFFVFILFFFKFNSQCSAQTPTLSLLVGISITYNQFYSNPFFLVSIF